MTERIVLNSSPEDYEKYFGNAWFAPPKTPNSSAPDDKVQIIHMLGGEVLGGDAVWGFVPQWRTCADDPAYYAAGSSIARKWTYSVAFRNWRCIVPATSFLYVRKVDGVTMNYELSRRGGGLMLLGGIYEPNPPLGGGKEVTTALVTTMPSRKLAPYGLQVPVLLNRKQVMPWLRSRTDIDLIKSFVVPPAEDSLILKISVEGATRLETPVQADLELV